MKLDSHANSESLVEFIEQPESTDNHDLKLHLAHCPECRQRVNLLSDIQQKLRSPDFIQQQLGTDAAIINSPALEAALAEQQIEQYVDQQLDCTQTQTLDNLIETEPQALKAALHYASHQAAMRRELSELDITESPVVLKTNLVGLIKKYLNRTPPVWLLLPVSGFGSIVLVLVFNAMLEPQHALNPIVSYQDNAVIQFSATNNQPGIGFFSSASKKIKPFNAVSVTVSKNGDLKMSWPTVENALSYTIQLKKYDKGQHILVSELSGNSNSVLFNAITLQSKRRYQWTLTGKTSLNETFYASGGFVSR